MRGESLRRATPTLLLIVSLAASGVGALHAHRTHASHRATAESLLRDYGSVAAWNFGSRWAESVRGGLDRALFGSPGTRGGPHPDLTAMLEDEAPTDCGCGPGLMGPASWAFRAVVTPDGLDVEYSGPAPDETQASAVVADIMRSVRTSGERGRHRHLLTWASAPKGGARLLGVALSSSIAGDTVVHGFEVDGERLRETLEATLLGADLLPMSLQRGRKNADLLTVRVESPAGDLLYASEPEPLSLAGEHTVEAAGAEALVLAAVRPTAAGDLIIGGLPGTRLPYLLVLFALSAVLATFAVLQMRRESAFARQRQDFVAGVSHELRTPLAQILLFLDTLRLGRTRTEQDRDWALATIDRETRRLSQLVENILHFSAAEKGLLAQEARDPTDLATEVEAVVTAFRPLLRPGQADLRVRVSGPAVVDLHRDGFRQAVLNLLDNAVKYGPPGQTIDVLVGVDGGAARVTVEDEGPGIPPDERALVFEAFQRGRDSLGSAVAGSGIGLSVVADVVRSHGGRVWIEEGRGARFVLEWPLAGQAGGEALMGSTRKTPS